MTRLTVTLVVAYGHEFLLVFVVAVSDSICL